VGSVIENNISLTKQLIAAMTIKNVKPYLIFTSSIHDQYDTEYGQCKREENRLLSNWASNNKTNYSCIVLSNIFGPQCKPNYASFIATFCYKLVRNEAPIIEVDNIIRLTYIDNLTSFILKKINNIPLNENIINEYVNVPWDIEVKVSEVLLLLNTIKRKYILEGIPPDFSNQFEKNLYTTLISYYN
jgi:UDP-2-acetamido-2,6-beta-L-arabino-hexul-4-ose reductase